MINRIVLACVVAVVVYLVCVFVGGVVLTSLAVPIVVQVGRFLEQYAGVIAALAGLWHFFSGGGLPFPR